MHSPYARLPVYFLLILWSTMSGGAKAQTTFPASKALIYSATADFRHDSIPTAIQSLKTQGPSYNVQFDQTEDMTLFTDDRLAQYDALVFLDNTGEGKARHLLSSRDALT